MPAPLDALIGAGLGDFRIAEPNEIESMLRKLCAGNELVNLHASDGSIYSSTIWSIDSDRGTMGFNADSVEASLQALLDDDKAVVVAYLNNVKLQFEVSQLVLVRGNRACVLRCTVPREVFRFQRRNAYRVRPLMRSAPTARLRVGATELALRVIDVSIGGCALLLPDGGPAIARGTLIENVEIDLDADTRFTADLCLRHSTAINAESRGARLGFEIARAGGDALRSLQRFIDQSQKRGKLLALD